MTMTSERPARLAIELRQGELAAIPVPEGRVVLENQQNEHGHAERVVVLYPHGDKAPHELARFSAGSTIDNAQVLLVSLAAVEAWR